MEGRPWPGGVAPTASPGGPWARHRAALLQRAPAGLAPQRRGCLLRWAHGPRLPWSPVLPIAQVPYLPASEFTPEPTSLPLTSRPQLPPPPPPQPQGSLPAPQLPSTLAPQASAGTAPAQDTPLRGRGALPPAVDPAKTLPPAPASPDHPTPAASCLPRTGEGGCLGRGRCPVDVCGIDADT